MGKAKKIILWVVIIFFIYAILTSPEKAAGIVANLWGIIVDGFNSILTFFDSLIQRT